MLQAAVPGSGPQADRDGGLQVGRTSYKTLQEVQRAQEALKGGWGPGRVTGADSVGREPAGLSEGLGELEGSAGLSGEPGGDRWSKRGQGGRIELYAGHVRFEGVH